MECRRSQRKRACLSPEGEGPHSLGITSVGRWPPAPPSSPLTSREAVQHDHRENRPHVVSRTILPFYPSLSSCLGGVSSSLAEEVNTNDGDQHAGWRPVGHDGA